MATNDSRTYDASQTETTASSLTIRLKFDPAALAPVPDKVLPDNLISSSAVGKDINVTFTPDEPPGNGHEVKLVTGTDEGTYVKINPTPPYTTILVLGADKTSADGTYPINYRMKAGAVTLLGPLDQSYVVDTRPPGGGGPGPIQLNFPVEDGLALDTVPDTGLDVSIYGYEGMAPGDKLYAQIGGSNYGSPIHTVTTTDMQATSLPLKIPKEAFPESDGPLDFVYVIADRPGNAEVSSKKVTINTIAKGLKNLDAAIVNGFSTAEPLLDFDDANALGGAEVTIPFIQDAQVDDIVSILWGSRTLGPYTLANASDKSKPALVTVLPYGEIFAEWNAVASGHDKAVTIGLGYKVKRANVVAGVAPILDVVTNLYVPGAEGIVDPDPDKPGHDLLLPPIVYSADRDENFIPGTAYGEDAKAHVPRQTSDAKDVELENGDVITVFFGKEKIDFTFDDAATDLDDDYVPITVPATVINGQSGIIPVWYTLAHDVDGGTGRVSSPKQEVTVVNPKEVPGEGSTLAEPMWTNPHSEAGEIWLNDLALTVIFEIPDYARKAVGDVIRLEAELTLSDESPRRAEPPRHVIKEHRVGATNETTTLSLTWADVIPDVGDYIAYNKVTANYSITDIRGATSEPSSRFEKTLYIKYAGDFLDPGARRNRRLRDVQ